MKNLYISSLKKATGKTTIAASLLATMQSLSYYTGYFKVIQSGLNSSKFATDELYIKNMDSNIISYTSYLFDSPCCPLIGAFEAGIGKINIQKIVNDFKTNINDTEFNIIEGSNSISSPIDDKLTEIDLIKALEASIVLVVDTKKDTLDELISGINYIHSNGITLEGIIINSYNIHSEKTEEKYFPSLVKEFSKEKIIGCFPYLEDYESIEAGTLIAETLNHFNVGDIFGLEIAKLKV